MDRYQILAFRLKQHHLVEREPLKKLESVASSGILNGLGGVTPLALANRLEGFRLSDLEEATLKKKSLIEISGPRAAGWIVPTRDFDIFTLGAAPEASEDLGPFLGNAKQHLSKQGVEIEDALEQVIRITKRVLKGKALTQDQIHAEWRKHLPKKYLYHCKGCKSWHLHWMLVGAAGLKQAFCYGPVIENNTAFVEPADWLPKIKRRLTLQEAQVELLRRFLNYYGPSDKKGFSSWSGLSMRQVEIAWKKAEGKLFDIQVQAQKGAKKSEQTLWVLADSLKELNSPPQPKSARLLPPRDPFLDLRDREILLPNSAEQKKVWRILGNPGVLMLAGELAATWRTKKKAKLWEYKIELLPGRKIPKSLLAEVEQEAELLARVGSGDSLTVNVRIR